MGGNKYYEYVRKSGKVARTVENVSTHEEYSEGSVPVEWEAWIRGKRSDPPTQQEIDMQESFVRERFQKAEISRRLDDERQDQAFRDGLITRESVESTQHMVGTALRSAYTNKKINHTATENPQQDAESWSPGGQRQADAWTPGKKK